MLKRSGPKDLVSDPADIIRLFSDRTATNLKVLLDLSGSGFVSSCEGLIKLPQRHTQACLASNTLAH